MKALTVNAGGDPRRRRIASAASKPGKDANLFISKGDPLEAKSQVTHVVIQGKDVGLDNKHLALYQKYIARQ